MDKQFYVYIITNKPNGILYVGVTSPLQKRIYKHKSSLYEGFSKKYRLDRLVYYEPYPDAETAISAEKRMKKWDRAWKIKRILHTNPQWNDLYLELNQ